MTVRLIHAFKYNKWNPKSNWFWFALQEEQSETDIPLTPAGLNFQLALFQNQMAQIQMMQAANATAMLNMGAGGLQTGLGGVLNPGVLKL